MSEDTEGESIIKWTFVSGRGCKTRPVAIVDESNPSVEKVRWEAWTTTRCSWLKNGLYGEKMEETRGEINTRSGPVSSYKMIPKFTGRQIWESGVIVGNGYMDVELTVAVKRWKPLAV